MCLPHACAVTWSLVRRVGHQIKVKFVQQGHQTILKRTARDLMVGIPTPSYPSEKYEFVSWQCVKTHVVPLFCSHQVIAGLKWM